MRFSRENDRTDVPHLFYVHKVTNEYESEPFSPLLDSLKNVAGERSLDKIFTVRKKNSDSLSFVPERLGIFLGSFNECLSDESDVG